jgi:NDP-sugar pyrophosphorylase family protein
MKPTLVILAAGMGSRYGGLKQVDKLGPGGETIIDYSVFDAMRAGFGKVVFVIRKSIEQDFMEVFADRFLKKVPYEIVFQELDLLPEGFVCPEGRTKPWGTAHALWVARKVVKEPFVVINADDFYGREAYQTLADFLQQQTVHNSNSFAMCGYRIDKTLSEHGAVTRAICPADENGYLLSVDEQFNIERNKDGQIISYKEDGNLVLEPDTNVSMNIWAFNPSIFDIIEENFLHFLTHHIHEPKSEIYTPRLVDDMIKQGKGKVKVLQSPAKWFGVTYANDKQMVLDNLKYFYENNEYPGKLWG